MDEMSPITGGPYASALEYAWTHTALNATQVAYLTYLARARRTRPNPALDGDVDPTAVPQPAPRPDPEEEERPGCLAGPIPRRGGHRRHDAYATKVSGQTQDYLVTTPPYLPISYDGRTAQTVMLWEVKVGFGWFFNPAHASLRDVTLARFDAQKSTQLAVARKCGYMLVWTIPDRWVAALLNARWGGSPPVLSIPEF
jgi:hypothetical protein